jgi:hypothetical protein
MKKEGRKEGRRGGEGRGSQQTRQRHASTTKMKKVTVGDNHMRGGVTFGKLWFFFSILASKPDCRKR